MSRLINLGAIIRSDLPGDQLAFISPVDDQRQRQITFSQLDRRADAIGRGLLARGLATGCRVAIIGRNSIDSIACLLGILRAGLVAVPLNHKFPADTLEKILADSDARLIFGEAAQLARIESPVPTVSFDPDAEQGLDRFVDEGPLDAWPPGADSLALLLYTSGSTGMPKGVRLTHASQRWTVETRLQQHELDNQRILIAAPLYHMNALALSLLALASHITAVLLPQFSAAEYIRAIDRYRCSWLSAVPPMIAMMLQQPALLAQSSLASVKVVRMGSAPVNQSLYQQIHQLLPEATIINAYGTTEGGPVVFGPHPHGLAPPLGSPGYPHPQVQVRLRDAEGRESAERGILEMKSPGLMQGYHQRPDIRPPFTEEGFYITGDVFERDEQGFFSFVGRQDDMFVSGAENIYPSEVEHLLERHPAVQQACVVAINDDIKGTKPVAWVRLHQGHRLTADALKAFALAHGPAYLHPRHIWFVENFTLASTNKIDRRALTRAAQERVAQEDKTPGGDTAGING
ncbi:class I adenylate-forming enzyme family protein [Biostraticola tofi]|uniref:Acyl-CoA synthetase (AMP-forming)/AMP-acid ligase II n=1 Tax=Biostraticola tofi TaxID=466109 RepID=A0A4R3Z2V7_9GAMM|nr:class I adenylate-forming enzyme family protein [Biostraticola tofi]TCW00132.1 acyl-CoA synthetase (AMP-forming)/AMP-acid ligase II [Biostraticola tofi]